MEARATEQSSEDFLSPRSEPLDAAEPSHGPEQDPADGPPADAIVLSPAYQAKNTWLGIVSIGRENGWLLSEKEVGAKTSPLLDTLSLLYPLPL